MNPDNHLSNYLLLYQFADEGAGSDATLHIQIYPGSGDNTIFTLLQERIRFHQTVAHFYWEKPLRSLSVGEGDIVFIHTIDNEIVTAGGIWQVQWRNDYYPNDYYPHGHVGYVFQEITSSGIEMVEVKALLQEEDFALFSDAVAHAKASLEESGISNTWLVAGREVGSSAPEITHQVTPLPSNIRVVEHSWYMIFAGDKEDFPTSYFLVEVVYRFQNQGWQFSARVLEERDEPFPPTIEQH